MRVERNETGVHIKLAKSDVALAKELKDRDGPFEFTLPAEGVSQPHVPLRAAMAIIKIGCSICPKDHLQQCNPAIDWLMKRKQVSIAPFPMLHVFTPGIVSDKASEVLLLRRKGDEQMPYFWIVLQFKNFRLQTFMPFCPQDSHWFYEGTEARLDCVHFPSKFGPKWYAGETEYQHGDWSGTKPVKSSPKVSIQFLDRVRVDYDPRLTED